MAQVMGVRCDEISPVRHGRHCRRRNDPGVLSPDVRNSFEGRAMQSQNPFLDQLAKTMADAAGAADGVRREAETVMRSQLQRLLADMELVTREEFEIVRETASAARAEADELRQRLAALEEKIGQTREN